MVVLDPKGGLPPCRKKEEGGKEDERARASPLSLRARPSGVGIEELEGEGR